GLFLLAANMLCLLLFFRATLILALMGSFKPARRFLPYVRVLARYNFRELLNTLLLAGLRYAVFCLQFGLLLSAFGIDFSFLKYVSAVSSTFLLKSVMPSFSALTDIGMREVSAM